MAQSSSPKDGNTTRSAPSLASRNDTQEVAPTCAEEQGSLALLRSVIDWREPILTASLLVGGSVLCSFLIYGGHSTVSVAGALCFYSLLGSNCAVLLWRVARRLLAGRPLLAVMRQWLDMWLPSPLRAGKSRLPSLLR